MSEAQTRSAAGIGARLRAAEPGRSFPDPAIAVLRDAGWLAPAPYDAETLFHRLIAAGRGDLAAARLFEGHVNALALVERYGSSSQIDAAHRQARAGGLGGVWAASDPSDPARLDRGGALRGRLGYCSGAERLAFALIAVDTEAGDKQLVRLDPGALADRFDHGAWRVRGMATTRSAALRLEGLTLAPDDRIGAPGDYLAEPFFSAGAIRFAAAQAGGLIAVFDALRDHLARTGRFEDPSQAARLSEAGAHCEMVYAGVRDAFLRIGDAINARADGCDAAGGAATLADGARQMVLNAALGVMERALASVGASGLFEDHPLSRAVSDLQMYLRQPGPDAARRRHGAAIGSGRLALGFDRTDP